MPIVHPSITVQIDVHDANGNILAYVYIRIIKPFELIEHEPTNTFNGFISMETKEAIDIAETMES